MKRLLFLAIFLAMSCVHPPPPTAAARVLERNPRAIVEGRVVDSRGRPVVGILVEAIPRGKDITWSPPAMTDSAGRFALSLFAPAEYGFVLREGKISVVTADSRDPACVHVAVAPNERRGGVELVYLAETWDEILAAPSPAAN